MFTPNPDEHAAKARLYQEESAKCGRDYKLGEHTGILKIVGMADTREEAIATYGKGMQKDFAAFFGPFGYLEVLRKKEDDRHKPISPEKGDYKRMNEVEMALLGSPDDVKRGIQRMLDRMPDLEWFGLFMQGQQGVLPLDTVKRNLECSPPRSSPSSGLICRRGSPGPHLGGSMEFWLGASFVETGQFVELARASERLRHPHAHVLGPHLLRRLRLPLPLLRDRRSPAVTPTRTGRTCG